MATITLYKNRINGVGGLIDSIIKSVSNIDIQLSTLKTTLQGVDSSTCNLQDTVDSISSSSKSEKEKTEDLKRLNNKLADFINNTTRRDNSARDNINKEKKNFYTRYKHLKPECENKKTFLQKLCSAFISVEKWCCSTWEKIINYDYFNFLGKLIHKEWFRTIISDVVGLFYRAGGYTFIKWLANTGTKLALFNRKHPLLSCFIPGLSFLGNLAPDFFLLL